MYTIHCTAIERTYKNNGLHCEQMLAYTLTNEMRRHDICPFDKGSDIPEYHMSVKSSGATLASGHLMKATTYMEQIDEYFERTASTSFAYVAKNNVAYVMDAEEFKAFLLAFSIFTRDSAKNGGQYKVRLRSESAKMMAYFAIHLAN